MTFFHYIKPTLQNPENSFETVILHMDVHDLLERNSYIDVVTNNIMNIANECKTYGIKNIFKIIVFYIFSDEIIEPE